MDNYNLSDISWRCAKCKNKYSDYCYNNCMTIHNKLFPSWNNIKYCMPIIKHIVNLFNNIEIAREERYEEKMTKKYGDTAIENEDYKFIWGIKSADDLTGHSCNLYTMNDIDITYDKKNKVYYLGIETAYMFKNHQAECDYLKGLLNGFTIYMDTNKLNKNEEFMLFMGNPCIDTTAKSIEELYTNFRIFVEGYCKIYEEE